MLIAVVEYATQCWGVNPRARMRARDESMMASLRSGDAAYQAGRSVPMYTAARVFRTVAFTGIPLHMLRHGEIREVALDLGAEVGRRDYVHRILAPSFVDDPTAWEMVVEVMEVVLHRRGLVIAPSSKVSVDIER